MNRFAEGEIIINEEEFYIWLGQYLKGLRMSKKWTQSQLCSRYHLSRSSLSNIELGRHHLSAFALYKLLRILDEPFVLTLKTMTSTE
ncbi:helix-turn-helix domain-containing protein [Cohnella candidum]|uniref:XRE family transcriptional regulator n=1 Tax=Cohnella candidum TaxID=2674991 RepID=A0A3G3JW56_9BACL|nr:XRE family transcriptional regulator [Cohnella candidum]